MDTLRNLIKSDTPTKNSNAAISGQGTHFPGSSQATGSTVSGTEPQTVGASDVSAAAPPSAQASTTAGPEAGGQEHVSTIQADTPATSTSTAQPTTVHTSAAQEPTPAAASTSGSYAAASSTGPTSTGVGLIGAGSTGVGSAAAPSTTTPTLKSYDTPSSTGVGSTGVGSATAPSTTASTSRSYESPSSTVVGSTSAGSAAVGSTTTYSTQHLAKGDPTSSVVDHESTDPLTYRTPEHVSSSTVTTAGPLGVTSDAAATAASKAWASHGGAERMPGEFPEGEYENPYRASRLDPRVDGGKYTAPTTSSTNTGRDAALGATAGGIAGLGAAEAYNTRSTAATGGPSAGSAPAPAALTTTADPADRSTEYNQLSASSGLDNAQAVPMAAAGEPQTQPSIGARALGSLAAVAGTAAAAVGLSSGYDNTQPGAAQQAAAGPPARYRRESIPTTAYPSGTLDSPRAVAPPLGGSPSVARDTVAEPATGPNAAVAGTGVARAQEGAQTSTSRDAIVTQSGSSIHDQTTVPAHTSRDAAIVGGTAAAVGTGAYGVHEHNKTSDDQTHTGRDAAAVGGSSAAIGTGAYATHEDNKTSDGTHAGRDTAVGGGSSAAVGTGAYGTHEDNKTSDGTHTGRDAALVGGAAATIGTGAYGIHEHNKASDTTQTTPATTTTTAPAATGKYNDVAPTAAVAAAPGRYDSQDYKQADPSAPYTAPTTSHTTRDVAAGTAVGAGAGALAGHEMTATRHEKELAASQAAREAEQNKHQKDLPVAAAGVGAAGAGAGAGAVAASYEADKDKSQEKEKKPNILKRIFKRRKNKDTGEDEDYETDEDESKPTVAAAGTSQVGSTGSEHGSGSGVPTHHSDSKGRTVLGPSVASDTKYEELSGGAQKPSYNPFKSNKGEVVDEANTTGEPYGSTAQGISGQGHISPVAGGANMTHAHPGRGTDNAPLGDGRPAGSIDDDGEGKEKVGLGQKVKHALGLEKPAIDNTDQVVKETM